MGNFPPHPTLSPSTFPSDLNKICPQLVCEQRALCGAHARLQGYMRGTTKASLGARQAGPGGVRRGQVALPGRARLPACSTTTTRLLAGQADYTVVHTAGQCILQASAGQASAGHRRLVGGEAPLVCRALPGPGHAGARGRVVPLLRRGAGLSSLSSRVPDICNEHSPRVFDRITRPLLGCCLAAACAGSRLEPRPRLRWRPGAATRP